MNQMKPILFLLTLGVFLTATSELIVTGVIGGIAADLNISLALAGQLVTVFSLSFAIGTPIVVSITSRWDRKTVLISAGVVFTIGCLTAWVSPSMDVLIASRIVLGISSGVFLVVSFGVVAKIMPPERLGHAVSMLILGFSSAMVIGIPIGIFIADWLSWREIFLFLCVSSAGTIYAIYRLLPAVGSEAPVPFLKQFKVFGRGIIITGLLITLFREWGNNVLFAYLIPFMQTILDLPPAYSSVTMLVLGIAGAAGARFGGYAVDRWGATSTMIGGLILHIGSIILMPLWTGSVFPGLVLIGLMVISMFTTGPAIQSFFIQQASGATGIVLSINTSFTHIGLAAGAATGGLLLQSSATLLYHPYLAGALVGLGLLAAIVGFLNQRNQRALGR
ncbi:MFS transporter [Paenibacillus daejeonensis]|uniref:MFS transporter n=1 Tax=Paenibacillus daejeonensis TaxID=135193 RepID=UPI00036028A6|nr:MFS transporter [Paenibacillus daejeonensis]